MIGTPNHDIALQPVGAGAHIVVGIGDGTGPIGERKVRSGSARDTVESRDRNNVVRESSAGCGSRTAGRIVDQDRASRGGAQVGEVPVAIEYGRNGGSGIEPVELPRLLPGYEEVRLDRKSTRLNSSH